MFRGIEVDDLRFVARAVVGAAVLGAMLLMGNAAAQARAWAPEGAKEYFTDYYTTYDFDIINEGWEKLSAGGVVHVRMYRPKVSEGPYPGVIIVPPLGRPAIVTEVERRGRDFGREMDAAVEMAKRGIAVVLYNPPGQGSGEYASSGPDGRGGYMSQDALARVIAVARGAGFIDAGNIGIISQGGGLCDAAGALARHEDVSVKYLIDIDGPSDNQELTGYSWNSVTEEIGWKHVVQSSLYFQHLPTAQDQDPETEYWWSRREPARFAADMRVEYYQRVQFEVDIAQPPGYSAHALRLYDIMLGSQVAHLRFNHSPWDAPLPASRMPDLIPGRLDENFVPSVTAWAVEFAFMSSAPDARVLPPAVKPDVSPLPVPSTGYY